MIRFNVRVEFVGMVDNDKDVDDNMKRWMVKSVEKKTGEVIEEVFDAVVVASGHYSYPRLPSIKGGGGRWLLDEWTRHIYRACGSCKGSSSKCQITYVPPGLAKVISKHHNFHLHLEVHSPLPC
ncbi:hypothetical protein F2Q70_00032510 [Brassica cretica]|uniref:Flavin-containing monooxygenase n=1 Tax=Brassica cretica TaxID=69181 RepID=A0A8S9FIP5_BRACR|nr:hypothetical protein F2Q70_00032510 [Brassica cretica]KAF3593649.1 hypothetical protein DY000_02026316 [Brassica cretica]